MLLVLAAAVALASPTDLRAQAQALLVKWTDAQNTADLPAYTALYDQPRFHGTKRTPRGTTQYDWKAWLADRTKMMGNHPTVAAESVTIELWSDRGSKLVHNAIRVRFLQRWKSPRYADHGIKIIDLAYDAKASTVLIRREELLNSLPGWDTSEAMPVALISPQTAREAEDALPRLKLTAGDAERKLASLKDARTKKLIAGAILDGDLQCKQVDELEECGATHREWLPIEPKLAWPDPCVGRLAAQWAIAQLDGNELKVLSDKLSALFRYGAPEIELPTAILDAARHADDATRLRFLEAAVRGGFAELANDHLEGLGHNALVVSATQLHLPNAIYALDPDHDRRAVLTVLVDEAVPADVRLQLLRTANTLTGADFDAVLRRMTDASDCTLAMAAASLLSEHGDKSRLPHRMETGDAGRALCLVLADEDAARREDRLREMIGPGGLTIVESTIDVTYDGEPQTPITRKIRRNDVKMEQIPFGNDVSLHCDANATCAAKASNDDLSFTFDKGRLVEVDVTTVVTCDC